jgi:hypothetical protein
VLGGEFRLLVIKKNTTGCIRIILFYITPVYEQDLCSKELGWHSGCSDWAVDEAVDVSFDSRQGQVIFSSSKHPDRL